MGSLWNRSGTIERHGDDIRAPGAQAYFFSGGTTTPLTVYQDAAESAPHPHPVEADAFGRWPDIFVPYTLSYDVRVTTAEGVQLTYSLEIPNPDPVELTVTPPPSGTVETGMIHGELINTTKTGYVRLNGRTMGNGSSSGTERANDDTVALFIYLWNNLSNTLAPVSGGRGSSAADDFTANKTITLPDARGGALIGLDDMGNTAAGAFTGLTFSVGSAILAGSRIGANSLTLTIANLPAHSHTGTTNQESPAHTHTGSTGAAGSHNHGGSTGADSASHTHNFSGTTGGQNADHTHTYSVFSAANQTAAGGNPPGGNTVGASTGGTSSDHGHNFSGTTDAGGISHTHSISTQTDHSHSVSINSSAHSHGFTTNAQGSGTAVNNLPLSVLVTWFIKL